MAPRLAACCGRCLAGARRARQPASERALAQQPEPPLAPAPEIASQGVIEGVRVEGNQRIEAATIRSYMVVEIGDRFDPAALDQSLKNLYATGLFDDVALRREGDQLVVSVVENPIINRIAFEGNRRLDDETAAATRCSCGRAWSTPARGCRTRSAGSSSSTGATAASPRPSSPR